MSRKRTITPVECSEIDVFNHIGDIIKKDHQFYKANEKSHNIHIETFKEWKEKNPHHPTAKKNYPDDEYMTIIATYHRYFESVYNTDAEDWA